MIADHKAFLLSTVFTSEVTAGLIKQPLPTPRQWHDQHMKIGFEMGFLKVIDDDAYYKSTRRRRSVVAYTTQQERAEMQLLK